uniref:3-isopropylmalate dehydratase large subunit 1 n=1 Tax=Lygus hesperus TaxID=30085 RepID=A0A0A9YGM0_LYGHE
MTSKVYGNASNEQFGASGATTAAAVEQQQQQGIAPEKVVLFRDHVTNNKNVVTVEQINYSEAMRAYRVYQQDAIGIAHDIHPALRLVNLIDICLLAFTLFLALPLLSSSFSSYDHGNYNSYVSH